MEFYLFLKQSSYLVSGLCLAGIFALVFFLFMRLVRWDRRKQQRRLRGGRIGDRRRN